MPVSVLIALCTYNERQNLPPLLDEIAAVVPDADILIIDDNSPDGTGDWVSECSRAAIIKRPQKLGLGSAVLEAMNYAVEHNYRYLINLDADGSHSPKYIPAMLAKAEEGFDVVIGSRYVQGGGTENWKRYRRWMSRAVNMYTRILLGLKTRDNSGSFRCYRVELLRHLRHNSIVSRGYSFFEEVLYRLKRSGATFAEVPIVFTDRRFGQSKINKWEVCNTLRIIFYLAVTKR